MEKDKTTAEMPAPKMKASTEGGMAPRPKQTKEAQKAQEKIERLEAELKLKEEQLSIMQGRSSKKPMTEAEFARMHREVQANAKMVQKSIREIAGKKADHLERRMAQQKKKVARIKGVNPDAIIYNGLYDHTREIEALRAIERGSEATKV